VKQQLLGGLSAAEFLAQYWQKKPLLIRGAWPGFKDPISVDELAGLAMEDGVRARLVQEKGGQKPWQLSHGPFKEKTLRSLPPSHWTLLVSQVELWSEACAKLLDAFTFIPHWRADDLMISFAPPQGSVGPHVDSYDVFLLQGQGHRHWQIQRDPDLRWRPGHDLRLLKSFKSEESWVLNPGDMLYLPPGVAHYGVAADACLTYSIGFRAPAKQDLVADLFQLPEALAGLLQSEDLYTDPDLTLQDNPGELSAAAVAKLKAMVLAPLQHPTLLPRWLAAYVTKPGDLTAAPGGSRRPTAARLDKLLSGHGALWRSDAQRMVYLAPIGDELFFYAHGEEWVLHPALLPLVQQLCAKRCHPGLELAKSLPRGKRRQEGLTLLSRLVATGACYFGRDLA
jgi:50S ribosomal protein L16 3-hydroxylase